MNHEYLSICWIRRIQGNRFSVIEANENEIELSFSRTWNKDDSSPPLNIDKR